MKRKIMAGIMSLCTVFCMTGCKEVINEDSEIVIATVVDKYHHEAWIQPVVCGKVISMITHPAVWETTFQYNGYEVKVDDSEIYGQYEVGDMVECELVIYYYDDGSTETKLEWID